MGIWTNKQLSDAIRELTPYDWADETLISKLTKKEFNYLAVLVHKFGAEIKIYNILSLASKRK